VASSLSVSATVSGFQTSCPLQALWLKELESYIPFPPLQNPASYNLEQVMQQVRDMKNSGHAGE
jgi:hypothetical protein